MCVAYPLYAKHVREEVNNAVGVFLGPTYDKGKNLFTYGVEYHRVVSFPFGFLIDSESIPRNREGEAEYELFGLATLNLFKNVIVGTGPGLKFAKEAPETKEEDSETQVPKKRVRKLMGRIFAGYIFELPKAFELTPNASLDFSRNTTAKEINYGLTIGKKF